MKRMICRFTQMSLILTGALALVFAAGCGKKGTDPAASKGALTQASGKTWRLDKWVGVDGSKQTPGVITIAFDGGLRVSGNAGVNAYTGPAKFAENGAVDFSTGFVSTRMAGSPEAQARENRYLNELRLVRAAAIEGGRLVFTGDGKLRMEFVAQ